MHVGEEHRLAVGKKPACTGKARKTEKSGVVLRNDKVDIGKKRAFRTAAKTIRPKQVTAYLTGGIERPTCLMDSHRLVLLTIQYCAYIVACVKAFERLGGSGWERPRFTLIHSFMFLGMGE